MTTVFDFWRMQQESRRETAIYRVAFWIVCTTIFTSWGGYMMFTTSSGITGILLGFILMCCAVVTAFLAICDIIDLID